MQRIVLIVCLLGILLAAIAFHFRPKPISPATPAVTDVIVRCHNAEYVSACLKDAAHDLLEQYSLREILSVMGDNEQKPEFFSDCHLFSHYLGQEAFKRLGSVAEVFNEASRVCLGGAYHGAVEGYLAAKKIQVDDEDAVREEMPRICTQSNFHDDQEFVECNHGLGHAAMLVTDNDLVRALGLCDALEGKTERELCYTGAFMANRDNAFSRDHPSKYVKEGDPIYPCPILDERYQQLCYSYGVLVPFQGQLDTAIGLCRTIPPNYRNNCFQTIGRDRTMITDNPRELVEQCGHISEGDYRRECIRGVAYNSIIRFGSRTTTADDFCALVEETNREDCRAYADQARRATQALQ